MDRGVVVGGLLVGVSLVLAVVFNSYAPRHPAPVAVGTSDRVEPAHPLLRASGTPAGDALAADKPDPAVESGSSASTPQTSAAPTRASAY